MDSDSPVPVRGKRKPRPPRRPVWIPIVCACAGLFVILGATLGTMSYLKSRKVDTRLLGTWKSDADATIAEIRTRRVVTPSQEEAMRKLFGKMTITYNRTNFETNFDGHIQTFNYEIVGKDENSTSIKAKSPLTNEDVVRRIEFIEDTFWVEVAEFNMRECFRRIN